MAFWETTNVSQVHIELTNGCNAACPMCVRFHHNSPLVRPDLHITQITLEKFKEWFPPEFLKQCNLILFCGVHGDPSVARDMYEICQYISKFRVKILVNTNGGTRTPEWWEKLGKLFRKNKVWGWELTFSIDGLSDTNHLYRRNVDWNKLEKNVRAFTSSGAECDWDFLMFKHNEHQIEEARALSKEWGVTNFIPKKALGVDNGSVLTGMPAMNKDGGLDYWIEAPEDPSKRNLETPGGDPEYRSWPFDPENYRKLKEQKNTEVDYSRNVDSVYDRFTDENTSQWNGIQIKCKSSVWHDDGKEIFVDSRGYVLPCCYVGTRLNGVYSDLSSLQLHKHMNDYGWDKFDLNKHSLFEILEQQHLDRVFTDSWDISEVKCGRLAYCADTCGKFSSIDNIFTHEDVENSSKYQRIKDKRGEDPCLSG